MRPFFFMTKVHVNAEKESQNITTQTYQSHLYMYKQRKISKNTSKC